MVEGKSNMRGWMIQTELPPGSSMYTVNQRSGGPEQEKGLHLFSK